jgi:hypothetical protein
MHDAFFGVGTALNPLWMGYFREIEAPPLYVSPRRFLEVTGLRTLNFTGLPRQTINSFGVRFCNASSKTDVVVSVHFPPWCPIPEVTRQNGKDQRYGR